MKLMNSWRFFAKTQFIGRELPPRLSVGVKSTAYTAQKKEPVEGSMGKRLQALKFAWRLVLG